MKRRLIIKNQARLLMHQKSRTGLFVFFICVSLSSLGSSYFSDSATERTALILTFTVQNTTCQKPNGRIAVHINGGVAPFDYSISSGDVANPNGVFAGMAAGSYVVTVTDAIGATGTANVVLTNSFTPPSVVSVSSNPSTSCAASNGSLTINATGGISPYLYSLDNINYQASNQFTNLTAGAYICVAKDVNGCVSNLEPFNNVTELHSSCPISNHGEGYGYGCYPYRCDFQIYNVDGGTAPYLYSIDGVNFQSSYTFPYLPGGLYHFTVKDAAGLTFLFSASIIDICHSVFSINALQQPALCGQNGSITINATEGVAPYQYSIDGITYQSSNQFIGLAPGNYTVTVKDADDFTATKLVAVSNSCTLVTTTNVDPTCNNNDGKITAFASNGTAPYVYSIDGINYSSMNVFTGLSAGTYVINAKDALGAIGSITATLNSSSGPQISSISSTPTNCNNNSGIINITAQGGTAPLIYSINGTSFQNQSSFAGLAQGSYTVTVKDANGCIKTETTVIALTNTLTLDAGDTVKICEGRNGILNSHSNGTQFSWFPVTGLSNPTALSPIANPLVTTVYYLTGTLGVCSKTDSVLVIVKPAPLAIVGEGETICFGSNSILSGSGGITLAWSPSTYLDNTSGSIVNVINPQHTITYSLSVTDLNGCTSLNDAAVTINVTPPPAVFAGSDTSIVINEPFLLNAIDINNSGFNQYQWSPSTGLSNPYLQNPLATISQNTTYKVIAKTPAGCEGTGIINIKVYEKSDIFIPGAFTPNGDGKNDILKAIPVGMKSFERFTVYNRYGIVVFTTTDPNKGWDGKVKNEYSSTSSFVWIALGINFKGESIKRSGSVILIK